ncbi:MAG: type 1 glutamine amidotransferase [Brevinematales bacterium]|nr:type 1 glutamine amidotransferase [Brevinematales bacterium]
MILILKNETTEGPGLFGEILDENKLDYKIIDLDGGEKLPENYDFSALVVLGGHDSANDKTDKIMKELDFILGSVVRQKPYFGICLGMQLLVKALGGNVIKAPLKEIGFRDPTGNFFEIELTEKGRISAIFKGMGIKFTVFQLHGETVELIPEIDLLATGRFVKNQAVGYKNFAFGIQSHFEVTEDYFKSLVEEDEDLKKLDKEKLLQDFYLIKESYITTGRALFSNFLKLL